MRDIPNGGRIRGKRTVRRFETEDRRYEVEDDRTTITFWRIKPAAKHSLALTNSAAHLAVNLADAALSEPPITQSFWRDATISAIELLERHQLFDKGATVETVNALLVKNRRFTDLNQILGWLKIKSGNDPRLSENEVLEKILDERQELGVELGYFA